MAKRLIVSIFVSISFLIFVPPVFAAPTPTPTLPANVCPFTDNPQRPGGTCKETVPYIHTDISQYPITCTATPEIKLPYSTCNPPATHTCPSGSGTCITVQGVIETKAIQLGGLGPDSDTLGGMPDDQITFFYPFSGLANKPLNTIGTPRESFQTFWRLLTLNEQMNAKAKFLSRYKANPPDEKGNFSRFDPNLLPLRNSQFPYSPEVAGLAPAESSGSKGSSGTSGSSGSTGSNFCVDAYVDKEHFDLYRGQLASRLSNSKQPSFWRDYFIGYYNKLGATSKPYLFESVCGGKPCYQYILDQLSTRSCGDGKYINPSLAIAVALNETGGLGSADPTGANPDHFGCDRTGAAGYSSTIQSKLQCFVDILMKGCGKTSYQVLGPDGYGYLSDSNLTGLIDLLGMPQANSCSSANTPSPTPADSGSSSGVRTGLAKNGAPARYFGDPPPVEPQPNRSHPCGAGQEDMLDYFLPTDSTLTTIMANGEQLQNYPTTINGRPGFVETKSVDHHYFEEFLYDDKYIYHLRDTTWDYKCMNNGRRAFYSLFDVDGKTEGGQYMQRCVTPGQKYDVSVYINSYDRVSCKPCNTGFGVQSPLAGTTNLYELKDGKMYVTTVAGSGEGEVKIFEKGKGMTGYKDTKLFTNQSNATGFINKPAEPLINTCKEMDEDYTFTLSELVETLPTCLTNYPVCANATREYKNLNPVLKAKYEALMPFDFDNVRGYLVMRYIDPVTKEDKTEVLGENLPYVMAMTDLLNESNYGVANFLSPDFINKKRATTFTSNNVAAPETAPGVNYSTSVFKPLSTGAKTVWGLDGGVGVKGCQLLTKGPMLNAPLTYPTGVPGADSTFTQPIEIPVVLEVKSDKTKCPVYNDQGVVIGEGPQVQVSLDNSNKTRAEFSPVQDSYGRSIAVFNNPKMLDISRTISEGDGGQANYSLVNQFLPSFAQEKFEDIPMRAPVAKYSVNGTDSKSIGGTSKPIEKQVARKDGQAEADLCVLRNFWLIPAGMQKATPEKCMDPGIDATDNSSPLQSPGSPSPSPTAATSGQ